MSSTEQTSEQLTDADVDYATETAQAFLEEFEDAMLREDAAAAAEMFCPTSYWRDLVAFTWNTKTVENPSGVEDMLEETLAHIGPSGFELTEPAEEEDGIITAWFTFETEVGRGEGVVRLKDGGAWTFLTALTELKGYEEPKGRNRLKSAEQVADPDRNPWTNLREEELENLGYTEQPHTVIIGGGQGGIALGARLRQLGVPTIIVEKNDRPGDSWRNRYKGLALHDPVWYDHLPYIKFPDNWPVFSPKDKLGDWLEMYTRVMELNYWSKTEATNARYDEEAGTWEVEVNRDGEELVLRPQELVMATGMSGKPNVPDLSGEERFNGEVHHSSEHPGPEGYEGKSAVVVGSNNSAHDICEGLWEVGADVTMVQRSSTCVIKTESMLEHGLGDLYSERAVENGIDTHRADMIFASVPYRIMNEFEKPKYDKIREIDSEFYDALEDAGFWTDFGPDESGLFMKYLRRGSGYYIDTGASQLIIDGEIDMAHGQVTEFTEDAILLEDGTELPADLVVCATGFGSMNHWVADLIDEETAQQAGKVWGVGSDTPKDPGPWEGEQRNMWKPTQVEHLWFHGGNLHQSRHYSLYLGLQLKARYEGIPTPVYGRQEVHHEGI
jgi:putative flavoprotein involved in K+ transport